MYYHDRLPLQILGRLRIIFRDAEKSRIAVTSVRCYKFMFPGSGGVTVRESPNIKAAKKGLVKNGDEIKVIHEFSNYYQLADDKVL